MGTPSVSGLRCQKPYSGRSFLSPWRWEAAVPTGAADVMRLQPLKGEQEEAGAGGWPGRGCPQRGREKPQKPAEVMEQHPRGDKRAG